MGCVSRRVCSVSQIRNLTEAAAEGGEKKWMLLEWSEDVLWDFGLLPSGARTRAKAMEADGASKAAEVG